LIEQGTGSMKPVQNAQSCGTQQGTVEHLVHAFVPTTGDIPAHQLPGGNPCLLKVLTHPPGEPTPPATGLTLCRSRASHGADDFDLKHIAPPDNGLSNWPQRAIICTAAQPSTGTDAITLRYFAPQYGVVEDTATGSAMRVLADYWSHRGQ